MFSIDNNTIIKIIIFQEMMMRHTLSEGGTKLDPFLAQTNGDPHIRQESADSGLGMGSFPNLGTISEDMGRLIIIFGTISEDKGTLIIIFGTISEDMGRLIIIFGTISEDMGRLIIIFVLLLSQNH